MVIINCLPNGVAGRTDTLKTVVAKSARVPNPSNALNFLPSRCRSKVEKRFVGFNLSNCIRKHEIYPFRIMRLYESPAANIKNILERTPYWNLACSIEIGSTLILDIMIAIRAIKHRR